MQRNISDSLKDVIVAELNIEALTDVRLIGLSISAIMELMQQYPEILKLYNRMLVVQTEEHWDAKQAVCRYKAAELIQWFEKTYPGMIDVIPHVYIASFLGISPVHFSRERNKEKENCNSADKKIKEQQEKGLGENYEI